VREASALPPDSHTRAFALSPDRRRVPDPDARDHIPEKIAGRIRGWIP
jgi:hypothetical protein